MIANVSDVETSHQGFFSTKVERGAFEDRSRLADIGVDHWKEIQDYFPVDGVHWRTKLRNEDCRLIVASFVRSALRDDDLEFGFNTKVLSKMLGSDKRQEIVDYFAQSQFSTIVKNHSSGNSCIVRRLTGEQFRKTLARQHNVQQAEMGDGLPCRLPCDRRPSQERLPFNATVWRYPGEVLPVYDRTGWFRQYGQRYRDACKALFPEQWRFLPAFEWSVAHCETTVAEYDACLALADKSIEWGSRVSEWQERRTGRPQKHREPLNRNELAEYYMLTWAEWCKDRTQYVLRTDGRLYYPLVNQPRGLRKSNMRFQYNGRLERCAEVDMSSTYYVLLASELHPSACKDRLLQDLFDGTFYEQLDEEAGRKYSKDDRDLLKIAVQIDCLFGKEKFGMSDNFKAMSRRYPDLAAFIMHKRKRHDVTWLSKKLTNAEGKLFIDGLLPSIVDCGIPCMTMHDALLVPVSVADQVKEQCFQMTMDRIGVKARFKVSVPRDIGSESLIQSA
jgi:hypothetical protein